MTAIGQFVAGPAMAERQREFIVCCPPAMYPTDGQWPMTTLQHSNTPIHDNHIHREN